MNKQSFFLAIPFILFSFIRPVFAQQTMKPAEYNLSSFPSQKKYPQKELLKELTPAAFQKHPGYGISTNDSLQWIELIQRRTRFTRTFISEKGDSVFYFAQADANYLKNGWWIAINAALRPSANGWSAENQPYPTYLFPDGSTALSMNDKDKLKFNLNNTINGEVISTSKFTTGENGMYIHSAFPGIDKKIIFSLNKIETDFIIQNSSVAGNGDLILSEEIILPSGYSLEENKEKGEYLNGGWKGELVVKDAEGMVKATFHTPIYYDSNPNPSSREEKYLVGSYKIKRENGKTNIQIIVPANWLNSPERVYPVTIDPPVTGPTATWAGGIIPSCVLPAASLSDLIVTIPAGVTITNLYVSSNYYANPLTFAEKQDGLMYFTTSCGRDPEIISRYWTIQFPYSGYDTPGPATLQYTDMKTTLSCCIAPACTAKTITITENLSRNYPGTGGCNADNIYTDPTSLTPFSAYVVGNTVGNPSGPANSLWSVTPGTVCADECNLTLSVSAYDGVPPYTVTHPWASGSSTFGSYTGGTGASCGTSSGNTTLALTIPGCPASICAVQSLNIPPPVITDACGNTVAGLSAKNITVNPIPDIKATPDTLITCVGVPFSVNLSSCVSGATINWSATNGMSGSGNITGTINAANCPSTSVTFTGTAKFGSCKTSTVTVPGKIIPNPNVSISITPAIACSGVPVTVTATGTGICSGSTYTWDFDGGVAVPGTGSGPQSVTWSATGSHVVKLTIDNGNGCGKTVTKSIIVASNPVASFSVSPPSVCPNQVATIAFTGSALPKSIYTWTFGTGTIVSGQGQGIGPYQISWSNPATETVTLAIADTNGCKSDTIVTQIKVATPPTGNFTSTPAGCLTANITYTGSGDPGDTYNWNFNGGTAVPSTGQGPISVTWPPPAGNHTVSLVVVTASGCTGSSFSAPVTVNNTPPTSAFSSSAACTGQSVTFTYTGNGAINDTYNWNFGAGANPATATGQGPILVIWNTPGNKTVSLTVGTGACVSAPTTKNIVVNAVPSSAFSASSTSVCPGDAVTLTYTGGAGSGAAYTWDFSGGNATPGTGQGPQSVKWSTAGTYNVSLQVSESGCTSASSSNTIVVKPAPSATFSTSSNSVCADETVTLNYTGNANSGAAYTWDFSGGIATPGTGQGPQSVKWITAGNKTVTLTVNDGGCSSIAASQNITVNTTPASTFTISSPSVCAGISTTLNYTGSASAGAVYVWDFKGGVATPGTGAGPHTVTWSATGTYNVTLQVTENGCTSSVTTNPVNVLPVPTSLFNPASLSVCAGTPLSISYTGNATPNATYNWNMGGGTASPGGTTQGPQSVTWSTAGTKTITLSVDEGGCSSTATSLSVTVNPTPTSTFSANNSSVCLGNTSVLTYTGTGSSSATYTWNFGGGTGTPGTGQGPQTISWSTANTYTVSLQVTENGCTSSTSNTIKVNRIPTADFNLPASSACINNPVTLNYIGNASASATYSWNFDGGNAGPGTGQGPQSVTWSTQGSKTVSLTVTENNCTSAPFTQNVTVNPIPVVSFSVSPGAICEGQSVTMNFTGTAGTNANYTWVFNGGVPQSGAGTGPHQVAYNSNGTFTASLIVTDNGCRDSASNQVVVNAYPLSSFSVSPSNICAGEPVTFLFNGSAKPGATYNWDFGNGQIISGSTSGPGPVSVKYTSTGTENVSLTVDQSGCMSSPFTQNLDINISPTAAFDALTLSACDQLEVNFLNLSNGASNYIWYFGDNTTDTSYLPVHRFGPGLFSVKLVATNPFGCKDSVTKQDYIKVVATPVAKFTSSPLVNTATEREHANFAFLNQSSESAETYSWNFGDGNTADTKNPVHRYTDTGSFSVTLIAFNELGCSDTFSLSPYLIVPTANIFIPNTFTPNNDGENDKFKVYGVKIHNINLLVFNRWGELLYDGEGDNEGWDGTYRGQPVNTGVYLYFVRATKDNGVEVRFKGDVSLIR